MKQLVHGAASRRSAAGRGIWSALVALTLAMLACLQEPSGPRPLTAEELEMIEVDARVSKWLPTRFSGTVTNNSPLVLHEIVLEIHGKRVVKPAKVASGESKRISLQFLFPEDADFGKIDPERVAWTVVGAVGAVGERVSR